MMDGSLPFIPSGDRHYSQVAGPASAVSSPSEGTVREVESGPARSLAEFFEAGGEAAELGDWIGGLRDRVELEAIFESFAEALAMLFVMEPFNRQIILDSYDPRIDMAEALRSSKQQVAAVLATAAGSVDEKTDVFVGLTVTSISEGMQSGTEP